MEKTKVGKMASMLKSARIILSVFLSLGFSLAHRLLLDQTNGGYKSTGPLHHEAVQQQDAKREGFGVEYGLQKGVVYGSENVHGSVPSIVIPIPEIPAIPEIRVIPGIPEIPVIPGVPGREIGPCVRGGVTEGNDNGIGYFEPDPNYEHHTPGGSATGAVKVMQEATHIVNEPYPPDVAHHSRQPPPDVVAHAQQDAAHTVSVPYPPDVAHHSRQPPPDVVAHVQQEAAHTVSVPYPPDVAHAHP